MKYAALTYSTQNIGDDIQTLAAMRFLPRIDAVVDRDHVDRFQPADEYKMIANGWFLHKPHNLTPSRNLQCLSISQHWQPGALKSSNSIDLIKKEPVGCRDSITLNRLSRLKLEAYLSGCLTLTFPKIETKNQLVVICDIEPSSELLGIAKSMSNDVLITTHGGTNNISDEIVDEYAKLFGSNCLDNLDVFGNRIKWIYNAMHKLCIYAHAKCVITSRIHVALPCIAMGTDCMFLPSSGTNPFSEVNQGRLMGMEHMFAIGESYWRTLEVDKKMVSGIESKVIEFIGE